MSDIQEIEKAIIQLPSEERLKLRAWFDEIDACDPKLEAPQLAASRGKKIIEMLRGTGSVKMSTDEIMALTRGE